MKRAALSILLVASVVAAPAADAKPRARASTWHVAGDWSSCDGPYDACVATGTADTTGRLTATASFSSDTSRTPTLDATPAAEGTSGVTASVKVPDGTSEMRVALHFVVESAEAAVDEPGTTGARASVGGDLTCDGCGQPFRWVDVALASAGDTSDEVGTSAMTVEVTLTAAAGETLPARVHLRALAGAIAGPATLLWDVTDEGPARVWPAVGASHASIAARATGFDVTFVPAPAP